MNLQSQNVYGIDTFGGGAPSKMECFKAVYKPEMHMEDNIERAMKLFDFVHGTKKPVCECKCSCKGGA